VSIWSRQGKELTGYSVGVSRRRADLWSGESAVISARQVWLTDLRHCFREFDGKQWNASVLSGGLPLVDTVTSMTTCSVMRCSEAPTGAFELIPGSRFPATFLGKQRGRPVRNDRTPGRVAQKLSS
jgi:hypothetical protein